MSPMDPFWGSITTSVFLLTNKMGTVLEYRPFANFIVACTEYTTQCVYKGNTETHSLKHCYGGKIISITYSEGVYVALLIQHEKSMRPIVFTSVASLDLQCFPTLPHKQHDFWEKVIKHKTRVLVFSTVFV
jgi:hypothetical protein